MKTADKHKLVIDEWFANGFNGAAAYYKYYPNSTLETARVRFSELVSKSNNKSYRDKKHDEVKEAIQTTHLQLLQTLQNWVDTDVTETMELTAKELKELPVEVRRLITEYKRTTRTFGENNENKEEVIQLKFVSKEKAVDMIAKHIGFFEKDNIQKSSAIKLDDLNAAQIKALASINSK